jgi:hypothetical protein
MRMGTSRALLAAATALAIAACLPSPAAAEPVVPPGNSAAAQYTEAFPTSGGEHPLGGGGHGKRKPSSVLGPRSARRLDAKGPQGRATAALATATAPVASGPGAGGGAGGGGAASGGVEGAAPRAGAGEEAPGAHAAQPASAGPHGSSGFEEVVGQATGSSSSGGMGMLLPLAIAAVLLWSLAYLWRQRRRAA